MTALWKSVAPQRRLQRRDSLLRVADFLKSTATNLTLDVTRDLTRAHALALALAHDLDYAQHLAFDLAIRGNIRNGAFDSAASLGRACKRTLNEARDLVRDPHLARANDLIRDIGEERETARALKRSHIFEEEELARVGAVEHAINRALARARELTRALERHPHRVLSQTQARDLARDLARDFPSEFTHAYDPHLTHALNRTRDITRALDFDRTDNFDLTGALDSALGLELDLDLILSPHLARAFADDLFKAHDNLTDAANTFVGADLTAVDLVEVNLAWIRWNRDTQWPTPEWTARIRTASVENPPGSGVFVVLPEEGHNLADLGSLAPLS
ncbi:hypothetical protein [Streptomyces sp. NPDC058441]|uniref:hypothetical protein n=1 Tax=Streptomyces sp. NPDC058441 TaxID=3346502 RepID=UPI0036505B6C